MDEATLKYYSCLILRFLFYFKVLSCLPPVPYYSPLLMSITCVSLSVLPMVVVTCGPLPSCVNSPGLPSSMSVHSENYEGMRWDQLYQLIYYKLQQKTLS